MKYSIIRQIIVGIAKYFEKIINGLSSWLAINKFCGFPMGLNTLPMVMANARDSMYGDKSFLLFLQSFIMTGTPIIAVVSFNTRADNVPKTKMIIAKTYFGLLDLLKSLLVTLFKKPDDSAASTIKKTPIK